MHRSKYCNFTSKFFFGAFDFRFPRIFTFIRLLGVRCLIFFREPSQKLAVGKKMSRRTKEKIAYVEKSHARSCTLYKRKSTLFSKGLKLHTMTKAEVLMIIDQHNGQRFVCGSDAILDTYNKGLLRPTQADHNYDGVTMADPRNSEIPSVEPLDKTPEGVSLDPRLAKVLGHETRDIENNTQSRRRLPYRFSEAVVPVSVQELILNKPKSHLNDKERSDVPPIHLQSKITFVSDENTVTNC